jgi:hypothetical protein
MRYLASVKYPYGLPSGEFQIQALEQELLQHDQVECPVVHTFGPGVYIREVSIPAGTFAIGHHQNHEHMNIMLKGRVTVLNEDGSTADLVAPLQFTGRPGRKVGYVHEDMVWLNIYATNETDVAKLEATYLTKSDVWSDSQASKFIEFKSSIDEVDYHAALKEYGFTHEQAWAQSCNTDDMTGLPFGGYKIVTGASVIHGTGLFATSRIQAGEIIAPARIDGKRTIAGRYTNHSVTPNAIMVMRPDGDIDLVAISAISGCHGGENGQEITINYRQALSLQINKEVAL